MPAPVVVVNAKGSVVFANDHAAALFQTTHLQLQLLNWADAVVESYIPGQVDLVELLFNLNGAGKKIKARLQTLSSGNDRLKVYTLVENCLPGILPTLHSDNPTIYTWTVDVEGNLLLANQAFIQLLQTGFGYPAGTPELAAARTKHWRQHYQRALRGESFKITDFLPNTPDSLLEINFEPVYEDATLKGVSCYAQHLVTRNDDLKQLEASKLELDKIIALTPDVICTINETGEFIKVSAAAEAVLGYRPEELTGKNFRTFLHPDDIDKSEEAVVQLLGGARLTNFENRFFKKDGQLVTLLWSTNYDASEGLMFCVARDATQKIKFEDQNRLNAELLKAVGQAVVAVDLEGNLFYWNAAATKIYGWLEEEVLGKNALDLISDRSRNQAEEVLAIAIQGGTWSGELYMRHKTGVEFPVYVSESPIYDRNNELAGIIGISSDISERKMAEREMSLMLNNTEEAFILLDNNLTVVSFNQQFQRLCQQYLGKTLAKGDNILNIEPANRQEIAQTIYRRVLAGLREESELELYDSVGSQKIFAFKYKPARDEENRIFGAFVTGIDVTYRKRVEQQRLLEQKRNEALINTTQDLIWSVNANFHLLAANKAFVDAINRSSGKQVKEGDNLLMDNYPNDWLNFWRDLYQQALTSGSFTTEIRQPAEIGEIENWNEVSFHPIKDNDTITGIACYSRNITDRKLAEQREKQAQEQQLLYTSIINSSDDAIVSILLDGTVTSWNIGAERMFGYSEREVLGRSLNFIIPPSRLAEDAEIIDSVRKGQDIRHIETERIARNGQRIYVLLTVSPIFNANGEVIGASKISKDITDRKRAEETIRKSEMQLAEAQHLAKVGSWELKLDTLDITWSAETWRIFEIPADQPITFHTFIDMVHPDDRERVETALKESLTQSTKQHCIEHCIVTLSGTEKVVEERWQIITNKDGEAVYAVGTCQDVTSRVKIEHSNNFKAKLLNTIGQATLATDINGSINYWNHAAETIYGFSDKEAIGKNVLNLLFSGSEVEKQQPLQDGQFLHQAWQGELLARKNTGEVFPIFINNALVFDQFNRQTGIISVSTDITERKKIDLEIEKSEQRYRSLFEQTLAGFYEMSLEGVILNCNNAFARMLKFDSASALIGRNMFEMLLAVDHLAVIEQLKNNRHIQNLEGKLTCNDGSTLFYIENLSLAFDEELGDVINAIILDISQKKTAEFALEQSEARLKGIIASQTNYVIRTDLQGRYNYYNPKYFEDFGFIYQADSLIGLSSLPSIMQYHHKAVLDVVAKCLTAQNKVWQVELDKPSAEGSIKTTLWDFICLTDLTGQPAEIQCVGIDITDRKKAEEKIRLSNERYDMISKATNDVTWDWDIINNQVTRSPENLYKMFGYTLQELQESSDAWAQKIHPDDAERIRKQFEDTFSKPTEFFMDSHYRFLRADGTYAHVYDKGFIIRNKEGAPVRMIGAVQDISKIKENELLLQKKADELAVSNKELEQFAYVASHDLQEPLRMITSFLTQLEKKYTDVLDEKGKTYIHFAVDGAKRMRQIILDLLEYSRIGRRELPLEQFDLNVILNDIRVLFQRKINDSHAIITSDHLPVLSAHKAPLLQLFQNLLGNALTYSRPGVQPQIHVGVKDMGSHWQFSVADNGIGINSAYFNKIFVLFQRLHSRAEYTGTGIGLAIAKKIVETLGGEIFVESQQGQGSTFYFTVQKN